jgi:hypothetical protein
MYSFHLFVYWTIAQGTGDSTLSPRVVTINDEKGRVFASFQHHLAENTLVMHKFGQNPVTVGSCSNNEVQRMNLTNSNDLVIQVVRNCGATTDYSTIILRQHKNDETLIAVYKGKPTVNFKIVAPNVLLISTGSLQTSDKFLENSNDNNLTIKYRHHGKAINVTDGNRLIAANFNYGATGLAAGMPKEALLIIAGWSQEASPSVRIVVASDIIRSKNITGVKTEQCVLTAA